jgi:hypothetical protein
MQILSKIIGLLEYYGWFHRRSPIHENDTVHGFKTIHDPASTIKGRATVTANREMLKNRDYTLIIDKSGSMAITDEDDEKVKNELEMKTRWELMQESSIALASKCEKLDPDGITLYTFSDNFKRFTNVTARKVVEIFEDEEPFGNTNLVKVLKVALDDYFQRKVNGQSKPNGETILVVTDGKPDDQAAVARVIGEATQKMDRDEELAISFIQIGKDKEATEYLNFLDDQLQDRGAKFDIVDTITIEEIVEKGLTLTEVLLRAITD